MKNSIKKRGQKFIKKFSRVSTKAREESKEHIKENVFERISHVLNIKLLVFEWCLLAAALIMLAATQAFWFGDSYSEEVFVKGGTYTEATLGKVNSMNPLFASTNSERVLSKLMFATLVSNDYSGHPGLEIAKSLTSSENGKKWILYIRDDIKWSDGEPLTNDDVIYTLELLQNSAVSSPYTANLAGVKIGTTDDGGITFTLPTAYADFISVLDIPIVPKHELEDSSVDTLIEDDFSISPVVSGPFMLNATQTTSSENERTVFLSPNPNYFKPAAMLGSFAIHTYETKDEIKKAINSGVVTATAELSGPDAAEITSNQFIKKESSIDWGTYIFFNTSSGKLKNRDLRSAIRSGIDINKIREAAPGTIAIDFPIIKSQLELGSYPKLPERNYEASAAKIAEISGSEKIHLNVVTARTDYLPEVAGALVEELNALGFEAELNVYEENQEFISNIISKRNYDVLVYDIELDADPDPLAYYHSSQISNTGLNLSGYRNSLVDDLLIGARETMEKELRIKKYETFLEHWVQDTPSIGLYQVNLTYVYNKNVRAYGNDVRLVSPIDRFTDVTSWAENKARKNKTP